MPGDPVDLWWLHSCATNTLHTRLRVQRAPGSPHALFFQCQSFTHAPGAVRRGSERVSEWAGRHCEERKRQSNPIFLCAARWIASRSLSSGAHSRDPVARNDVASISDAPPRSRGAMRPSCERIMRPSKLRAWGMPGARCTRSLVCSVLVAHECRHHGRTGKHPAFPHAMVLTVSFALSPEIGLFCLRRLRFFSQT